MKKAFTLIELLIVIAVIGILASILFVSIKREKAFWADKVPDVSSNITFTKEVSQAEVNQRRLIQNSPIPQLEKSEERTNLIKRLNRFNTENKISYIYLVNFGRVMAFYTIKGKVSSVNSLLTNPNQIVDKSGYPCNYRIGGNDCYIVPSPGIDGSYGKNGEAVFFFTTDDVYVEWRGDYMLVDQPLKLTTQPELVRTIK